MQSDLNMTKLIFEPFWKTYLGGSHFSKALPVVLDWYTHTYVNDMYMQI